MLTKFCVSIYLLVFLLSRGSSSDHTFAVTITTIPPRFSFIGRSLLGWFQQEIIPTQIYIFVPTKYKKFRQKKAASETTAQSGKALNYVEHLRSILLSTSGLYEHVISGAIQIVAIDKDFGPITKFVGLLQLQSLNLSHMDQDVHAARTIDHWVVADDDVHYSPITLSKYLFSFVQLMGADHSLSNTGLTHFSEDYRIQYSLGNEGVPRRVMHLQGVDTYLLSDSLLAQYTAANGPLHHSTVVNAVEFIHGKCPDAFYQDDYVVSLLLSLAGVNMRSVWNNDNMATHIEGVSKSNSQMHMHPKVFAREEAAKACIVQIATEVHQLIHQ